MAEEREEVAEKACDDPEALEDLIDQLADRSRLKRQKAASALAVVSDKKPELLFPYVGEIGDGLLQPEAQTRWELLHALDQMGKAGQHFGEDVLGAAEDALYDESNDIVRASAFRFFCRYGAASPENSDRVWPLIDEAVQCYHGDSEFSNMLGDLVYFAQGDISMETCTALALRMRFDAENGSGTLRMRSEQIVKVFSDRGGVFAESESSSPDDDLPGDDFDDEDDDF